MTAKGHDHTLDGYVMRRVMDMDEAEATGEIHDWPVLHVDLTVRETALLTMAARTYGVDLEDFLAVVVHKAADDVAWGDHMAAVRG